MEARRAAFAGLVVKDLNLRSDAQVSVPVATVLRRFGRADEGASMRSDDEIKEIIQQAFKPLRCVAEIWDYGEKIRFRVYRPDDKPLIQYSELTMREAQSDRSLSDLLTEARQRVEEKGYHLDPWQFASS